MIRSCKEGEKEHKAVNIDCDQKDLFCLRIIKEPGKYLLRKRNESCVGLESTKTSIQSQVNSNVRILANLFMLKRLLFT
jgi:hypothetical protein